MAIRVPNRRRFTAREYQRMGETGILHEDDRVELIEGEIIEMAPIGNRHFACVNRLTRLFVQRVGDSAVVHVQNPVRLSDLSEPQPDLSLLRPREDFYAGKHPAPEDVLLLVEVADTSLAYDREVKLPLYARAGIREVWIVDLAGEKIERHTDPTTEGYRRIEQVRRGETLEPAALGGLALPVDDVLG